MKLFKKEDQERRLKMLLWKYENGLLQIKSIHPHKQFTIRMPQGEYDFQVD